MPGVRKPRPADGVSSLVPEPVAEGCRHIGIVKAQSDHTASFGLLDLTQSTGASLGGYSAFTL